MTQSSRLVGVHYAVPAHRGDEAWELSDEIMPESVPHDEAVYSPELEAWLVVVNEGRRLRIAADEAATRFWLTAEEAERAAKEAALARVAELEARLKTSTR